MGFIVKKEIKQVHKLARALSEQVINKYCYAEGTQCLKNTPTQSTMTELLGQPLFAVWQELCSAIDEKYDMETGYGIQAVRAGL